MFESNYTHLIEKIQQTIAYPIGQKFFETIVISLAEALKADYTFVGEFFQQTHSVKTLALCANDKIIENIEYHLADTPCENVLKYLACVYPQGVQSLFPNDVLLQEMCIQGYLGVPLYSSESQPIGILVAHFKNPIPNEEQAKKILEVFFGRTSAELERVQTTKKQKALLLELEEHKEKLEELVQKRTEELKQALESLQNAQAQLIHSEKMASLGTLSAGIAHEINNPLNFISSSIYALIEIHKEVFPILEKIHELKSESNVSIVKDILILKSNLDILENLNDLKILSQNIQDGVRRISEIIKSLKIFSYSNGENFTKANIHEILENAILLLSHELKQTAKVIKNFDSKIPEIECIPNKLSQVFINLIQNSLQAFEKTGQIEITTKFSEKKIFNQDCIELIFLDDGKGIDKEVLPRIFDPFYTTKEIDKGLGLGLYISYGIIKQHRGEILVRSEVNQFTEVTIILPIIQV